MDDELRSLFDRLDDGQGAGRAAAECTPPLDVVETTDGVLVMMDIAGVSPDCVRVVFVRNVRNDQVDLGGPADDEHVAGFVTQPVPLLDQRIERADQPGQLRHKRREVVGRDAEVPVGVAPLGS